jgi:SNF2 family DNA or RNA helicase
LAVSAFRQSSRQQVRQEGSEDENPFSSSGEKPGEHLEGAGESLSARVSDQVCSGENRNMPTVETLIGSSGKMIMIAKLLGKLTSEGHRVLMKSRIIRFVDILAKYQEGVGIISLRVERDMNEL